MFYLEAQHDGATLRCKYAVISLAQFQSGMSRTADNVSLWARFSQQSRLVWARDAATIQPVAAACAEAVLTMLGNALPLASDGANAETVWQRAFEETYRAELRSEGPARAAELVNEADRASAIGVPTRWRAMRSAETSAAPTPVSRPGAGGGAPASC